MMLTWLFATNVCDICVFTREQFAPTFIRSVVLSLIFKRVTKIER